MKKIAYMKRGNISNIDMGSVMTILFLVIGILFNVYFCRSLLGIIR